MTGFDLRAPRGTTVAVDPNDRRVAGLVVIKLDPERTYAAVIAMKDPKAPRDLLARLLRNLAEELDPTPTKDLTRA